MIGIFLTYFTSYIKRTPYKSITTVVLLCFVCFSNPKFLLAEQAKIDSLQYLLNQADTDSLRIHYLNEVARSYWRISPDSSIFYAQQALDIAKQIQSKKEQGRSLNNLGAAHYMLGKYDEALSYWQRALERYKATKDSLRWGAISGNIGLVYERQGNYGEAMRAYTQSLSLKERLGAPADELAISYNNMGIVFEKIGDHAKAIEYHEKALVIRDSLGLQERLSSTYMNLGTVYEQLKEYSKALDYYEKSIGIKRQTNDIWGLVIVLQSMGYIHLSLEKPEKAKAYFAESLRLAEQLNSSTHIMRSYLGFADWALQQQDYEQAIAYSFEALRSNIKNRTAEDLEDAYRILHISHAKKGEYNKAYRYQDLHYGIRDSLFNVQQARKMGWLEAQNQFERERLLSKQAQIKRESFYEQTIAEQKKVQYLAFAIVGISLLFGAFLFRAYRLVLKKNQALYLQKEEIEYLKDHLDELVKQRTKEVEEKSLRISAYAYNNAHHLRGPLSRILGLVQSMKLGHFDSKEDHEFALYALLKSAEEMDKVVRDINEQLHD